MSTDAPNEDIQIAARERTLQDYSDLHDAGRAFEGSRWATLERAILIALFVNDGHTDGFMVEHDVSALMQAAIMWPGRSMPDWEAAYTRLSAEPEFQRYRLARDILVARSRLSDLFDDEQPPSDRTG